MINEKEPDTYGLAIRYHSRARLVHRNLELLHVRHVSFLVITQYSSFVCLKVNRVIVFSFKLFFFPSSF